MKRNYLFFVLLMGIICVKWSACLVVQNPYTGLTPGMWRGSLKLKPNDKPLIKSTVKTGDVVHTFEEVSEGELPFTFEVKYENDKKFYIEIINGDERIRVDDISMGVDRTTSKDTLLIKMPVYESYIRAKTEGGVLEGTYYVPAKGTAIPFVAKQGQNYRFSNLTKAPFMNITGKWETTFGLDKEKQEKAIGEFTQNGNHLTGTFLTETGDYRYLEGSVLGNKMYLSCFDGAHAYLFEGKINEDSTIIGAFRSGMTYETTWQAKRNPNFALANPENITKLKSETSKKLSFSFQNPEGKTINLEDGAYKGKVKLIQIMGTWCPNCKDESNFLKEYLSTHPSDKVAAIGLAFERHKDKVSADKTIAAYKTKMGIPYELVVAGYADKTEAAQVLPVLDKVNAFPTLIFVDKNNNIRKIHTGFSGPATSEYPKFKKEFELYVHELINE